MSAEIVRDPSTPQEWQEAADAAYFGLVLDSAIQYGLVTGPQFNISRCEWVLEEAKKRGIEPAESLTKDFNEFPAGGRQA